MSNSPAIAPDIPRHVYETCLCLHARRAARALGRRFDEAFRPFGITNGQFSLMMALNRVAPPRMGDVAATLAMDRTTVTAALKPLARRGLIAARPNPKDQRERRFALTEDGRALLARALPVWQAAHAELDQLLAGFDTGQMQAGLSALSRADEALEPEDT